MISINEFLAKKHAKSIDLQMLIYSLDVPNFTKIEYVESLLSKFEPSIDNILEELNKRLKGLDQSLINRKIEDYIMDLEDFLESKTGNKHYIIFGTSLEKLKNKSYYKDSMLNDDDDIRLYFKIKNYDDNLQNSELYILLK